MKPGRIEERFASFVRDEALLAPGEKVLVATSGGADSVALVHFLSGSGLDLALELAHFDHRMRAGSGADRAFVEGLAARLGLPCRSGEAEVPPASEAEAREVRYAFLVRAAREAGAAAVALAHHADDQAETVLFRALRGTGIAGLAAMRPRREEGGLRFVRPLLFATRAEIREWLAARGERWVEDPTNAEATRARNHLRHDVLAALPPRLFPAASANLAALAIRAAEAADFLEQLAAGRYACLRIEPPPADSVEGRLWPPRFLGSRAVSLDRGGFEALEPALVFPVLQLALEELGAPRPTEGVREAVEAALARGSDAEIPGGVRLVLEAGRFHLASGEPAPARRPAERSIAPGESAALDGLGLVLETILGGPPAALDLGPFGAAIGLGGGRLGLRPRREGDRFRPLGAPGAKPLAEVFTDRKVPRSWRDLLPVLTLDDRPVWAPGLPPDESVRVGAGTREILFVRLRSSEA